MDDPPFFGPPDSRPAEIPARFIVGRQGRCWRLIGSLVEDLVPVRAVRCHRLSLPLADGLNSIHPLVLLRFRPGGFGPPRSALRTCPRRAICFHRRKAASREVVLGSGHLSFDIARLRSVDPERRCPVITAATVRTKTRRKSGCRKGFSAL